MADLLTFEASVDHPEIAAQSAEVDLKCQIRVQASPALLQAAAPVVTHLCLVFDCSGSMIGKKLLAAIASGQLIADTLGEQHSLSLVIFAAHADVLIDNAPMTADRRAALHKEIDEVRLMVGGSTNLAEGIEKGAQALQRSSADAKVMVILTDGEADEPKDAEQAAATASASGIQIFAVGVGEDFEADRLLQLVKPSNGAVFGERDAEKITETFASIVQRVENFVATDAALTITFAPGVKAGVAFKTSPEQAFLGRMTPDVKQSVSVQVGNIERDTLYEFLLVVTLLAQKPGPIEVARAHLGYRVPALKLPAQAQDLEISVTCTEAPPRRPKDQRVTRAYREAQLVEWTEKLAEAVRSRDAKVAVESLHHLIDGFAEIGNAERSNGYRQLLSLMEQKGAIPKASLNASVLSSAARTSPPTPTPTPKGRSKTPPTERVAVVTPTPTSLPALPTYDVIFVEAGKDLIRVVREMRELMNVSLKEASEIVKRENITVREGVSLDQAEVLHKRLVLAGARSKITPHAARGGKPPSPGA